MTIYKLELINKSPNLDLRTKQKQIQNVLNHILAGGKKGNAYIGVANTKQSHFAGSISIISINQHDLKIDVTEQNTKWHKSVGQLLARSSYGGMRNYCNPSNPKQMFKWIP